MMAHLTHFSHWAISHCSFFSLASHSPGGLGAFRFSFPLGERARVGRFGLFGPLVLRLGLGISFLLLLVATPLLVLLTLVHPLITALLLMRVSREARALSQTAPAHTRLSFVLVSGMVITLLGGLLWNLSAVLGSLPFVLQFAPFLPAMGAAVFVAICTLFKSHKSTPARPKDASPSDVDSEHPPRGYRG